MARLAGDDVALKTMNGKNAVGESEARLDPLRRSGKGGSSSDRSLAFGVCNKLLRRP